MRPRVFPAGGHRPRHGARSVPGWRRQRTSQPGDCRVALAHVVPRFGGVLMRAQIAAVTLAGCLGFADCEQLREEIAHGADASACDHARRGPPHAARAAGSNRLDQTAGPDHRASPVRGQLLARAGLRPVRRAGNAGWNLPLLRRHFRVRVRTSTSGWLTRAVNVSRIRLGLVRSTKPFPTLPSNSQANRTAVASRRGWPTARSGVGSPSSSPLTVTIQTRRRAGGRRWVPTPDVSGSRFRNPIDCATVAVAVSDGYLHMSSDIPPPSRSSYGPPVELGHRGGDRFVPDVPQAAAAGLQRQNFVAH